MVRSFRGSGFGFPAHDQVFERLTFTPQGFVNTTGKVTFTGATGQTFPLQILYSGSMIRVVGTQS